MLITKEIFDKVLPNEVMRTVVTKYQNMHEPGETTLKFVAVKSYSGIDWAIYCGYPEDYTMTIRTTGDKVQGEDLIRSIMPCDDEVYNLYRR